MAKERKLVGDASTTGMTEQEMQDFLVAFFRSIPSPEDEQMELIDEFYEAHGELGVSTFADDLMTTNKGVVVVTRDGSEFQLTIVRSK